MMRGNTNSMHGHHCQWGDAARRRCCPCVRTVYRLTRASNQHRQRNPSRRSIFQSDSGINRVKKPESKGIGLVKCLNASGFAAAYLEELRSSLIVPIKQASRSTTISIDSGQGMLSVREATGHMHGGSTRWPASLSGAMQQPLEL